MIISDECIRTPLDSHTSVCCLHYSKRTRLLNRSHHQVRVGTRTKHAVHLRVEARKHDLAVATECRWLHMLARTVHV